MTAIAVIPAYNLAIQGEKQNLAGYMDFRDSGVPAGFEQELLLAKFCKFCFNVSIGQRGYPCVHIRPDRPSKEGVISNNFDANTKRKQQEAGAFYSGEKSIHSLVLISR